LFYGVSTPPNIKLLVPDLSPIKPLPIVALKLFGNIILLDPNVLSIVAFPMVPLAWEINGLDNSTNGFASFFYCFKKSSYFTWVVPLPAPSVKLPCLEGNKGFSCIVFEA